VRFRALGSARPTNQEHRQPRSSCSSTWPTPSPPRRSPPTWPTSTASPASYQGCCCWRCCGRGGRLHL